MTRIFVSYSRQDEVFARRIALDLEHLGANIWLDTKDISAGENWSTAIQKALLQADIMLVIISPASMASTNVEDEWQYFLDHKKPIIPIQYQTADRHFQLSRLQHVDFYEKDYGVAFEQLLSELRKKGLSIISLPDAPSPNEPKLGHILKRRLRINQPWLIILVIIITGMFVLGAVLINRPSDSGNNTSTSPATMAVALRSTSIETDAPPTGTSSATKLPLLPTVPTISPTFTLTATSTAVPPAVSPTLTLTPTASITPTFTPTLQLTSVASLVAASLTSPTSVQSIATATPRPICTAKVKDDGSNVLLTNALRSDPSYDSPPFGTLKPGQMVIILEKKEARRTIWYQIGNDQQDVLGWILEDYLMLTVPCPN